MHIELAQVLTQMLAFLLMLWIMKKFAWKPFLNILETRKQAIQAEYDHIAHEKGKVSKLMEEYLEKERLFEKQANLKIQEAVQQGQEKAKEIESQAKKNAVRIMKKSEEQAAWELEQAKKEIKEKIALLASKMAEKILTEKIDSRLQGKLIDDFIEKAKFDEI